MKHARTLWKWIAALVCLSGLALALLMAEPPTGPFLVVLSDFLVALWNRPFFSEASYGSTLLLVLQGTVLVVFLWFAARLVSRSIRVRFLDRIDLDEGHKFALQRIIAYSLFVFGALTAVHAIGLDVGTITVFSGALGIGLGLGFQTIAKNFASGLILLFEQPVKVGDRVEVGDLQGNIVTIRARATWVRTNDNVVMIVPNSEFIESRVTNLTLNDRNVRINVPLGVSYESDPEHVREILLEVGQAHPDVLQDPAPDVIFTGFGDSSLNFDLRVWTTRQVTTPRVIASELYFKLFAAFKREGIEIPFPQRDLHVRSVTDALTGPRSTTNALEADRTAGGPPVVSGPTAPPVPGYE